jgi:hypothetical protein
MHICNKQLYPRGIAIRRLTMNTSHVQPKCIVVKGKDSNQELQIPNTAKSVNNNYSRNRKHLKCETE